MDNTVPSEVADLFQIRRQRYEAEQKVIHDERRRRELCARLGLYLDPHYQAARRIQRCVRIKLLPPTVNDCTGIPGMFLKRLTFDNRHLAAFKQELPPLMDPEFPTYTVVDSDEELDMALLMSCQEDSQLLDNIRKQSLAAYYDQQFAKLTKNLPLGPSIVYGIDLRHHVMETPVSFTWGKQRYYFHPEHRKKIRRALSKVNPSTGADILFQQNIDVWEAMWRDNIK